MFNKLKHILKSKRFKLILIAYIVLKAIFSVVIIYSLYSTFMKQHVVQDTIIIIPKNSSIDQVSDILYDSQVIQDKKIFYLISKGLTFSRKYIKPGEYKFKADTGLIKILNKLINEKVVIHRLTIPEGLNNQQIFTLVDNLHALTGSIDMLKYKEGYLLPQTYFYTYGEDKNALLDRAALNMRTEIDNLLKKYTLPQQLKNVDDLLTLASIVEKEAAIPDERPKIAAVYLNRLSLNMPLCADPTVAYALSRNSGDKITYQDLQVDSPYNTYKYKGLPPAPIANPGIDTIKATLKPDDNKDLYFVSNGNRGHNFAQNYKDHLANVKLYRAQQLIFKT